MTFDITPALTPGWLAVSGALFIGIGLRGWLTSDERAAEHRSSINTGEEHFIEGPQRPTTAEGVEWSAKAEIVVGAALLAAAGFLKLTGQEVLW